MQSRRTTFGGRGGGHSHRSSDAASSSRDWTGGPPRSESQGRPGGTAVHQKKATLLEGVDVLKYQDPDAYIRWLTACSNAMVAKYGAVAKFVVDRKFEDTAELADVDIPDSVKAMATGSAKTALLLELQKGKIKRWQADQQAKQEIFGLLLSTLDPNGRQAVESDGKFAEARGALCPLKLLLIIESTHVTETSVHAANSVFAKIDAGRDLVSCRQKQGQTLLQYRDAFVLLLNRAKTMKCAAIPSDAEAAAMFMRGADAATYGQCVVDLQNDMLRNAATTFPASINAAFEMMLRYSSSAESQVLRPSRAASYHVSEHSGSGAVGRGAKTGNECRNCGEAGHWARECPHARREGTRQRNAPPRGAPTGGARREGPPQDRRPSTTQSASRHPAPHRTAAAAVHSYDVESTIYLALDQSNMVGNMPILVPEYDTDRKFAFAGVGEVSHEATSDSAFNPALGMDASGLVALHDVFIYDSGATGHLVNKVEYLTNVHALDRAVVFSGVTGKGGSTTAGTLPLLGPALLHPATPVNIISGSQLEELYEVRFVQLKHYKVYIDETIVIVFHYHPEVKLYVADLWPLLYPYRYSPSMGLASVAENKSQYSRAEVARADEAREMMRRLGHCSAGDCVRLLQRGGITRCPVTSADIHRAEAIYGPSVPHVKGSTVKRAAGGVVRLEPAAIERVDLELHCDVFEISQQPYLLTVAKPITLLLVSPLKGKITHNQLGAAISDHVNLLTSYGWRTSKAYVDAAGPMLRIGRMCNGVKLIASAGGSHVPVAERYIRFVKEKVRAAVAALMFPLTDKLMIECVRSTISCYNWLLLAMGTQISAREALTGLKLDWLTHLKLGFGDYCQVFNNQAQSNNPRDMRTLDCIALGPADNTRGSWRFYHLLTKAIITSDRWVVLPTGDEVIQHFRELYAAERAQRAQRPAIMEDPPAPIGEPADDVPTAVFTEPPSLEPGNDAGGGDASANIDGDDVSAAVALDVQPGTGIIGLQLGLRAGLKHWGNIADEALSAEVQMLLRKGTFQGVLYSDIPPEQRKTMIRCSLFFKEKFGADGSFLKLKARLVAGGDQQDVSGLMYTSSPTVNTENLFTLLAIAAVERRHIGSVDIEGAYLECDMEGPPVFMVLPPAIATMVAKIDPSYARFISTCGTMIVQLMKALYGCVQSSALWYRKLRGVLEKMGYVMNPDDECVFNREIANKQCTVNAFVDDLVVSHDDKAVEQGELVAIGSKFSGHKVQYGPVVAHLGMRITRSDNGDVSVDMESFTDHAVKAWEADVIARGSILTVSRYPADGELFVSGDAEPLNDQDRANYHSAVARLIYLVKRTRPDIAVAVSYLSSRTSNPTIRDREKLDKLIGYLKGTVKWGVRFRHDGALEPRVYSDAAFLIHEDAVSRTGVLIMIAGGVVYSTSSKQKMVTKSSAESELVALCEGATQTIITRRFMAHQGYTLGPSVMLEDNMATITLVQAGKPTSQRTKHINLRYFFIKQHLDSGELVLEHCNTKNMLADMLTKPIVGSQFFELLRQLLVELV